MTAELTSESRVFDYKLLVEEERGKVKIHAKSHKTMNPRWDLICPGVTADQVPSKIHAKSHKRMNPRWDLICCDSWTGHQYHQTRR
jgi:predicted double-glycine peptidase